MSHGAPSYEINRSELRRRRVNAGLTLRELAERCRATGHPVYYSRISAYERGASNPRPPALRALATALGCEPEDLIAREAAA